ncbi:putative RNA recognition motif domain, nucleotide-binding alpha-beta plait domain superfamily [Dioscorea sansibarensis]
MADRYWRYGDPRHPPEVSSRSPVAAPLKRQRSEYSGLYASPESYAHHPFDEERLPYRVVGDTESLGASYDRYLRSGQISLYASGEPVRAMTGGRGSHHVSGLESRNIQYSSNGRPETPLPLDASNTLYVDGLPADCTQREVAHIFRPFVGFREVRLVCKERYTGGYPFVLCFVDFKTPGQAAVALEALQGYKFDEHDRQSANMRLQFARFPGPRSSGGSHGRR